MTSYDILFPASHIGQILGTQVSENDRHHLMYGFLDASVRNTSFSLVTLQLSKSNIPLTPQVRHSSSGLDSSGEIVNDDWSSAFFRCKTYNLVDSVYRWSALMCDFNSKSVSIKRLSGLNSLIEVALTVRTVTIYQASIFIIWYFVYFLLPCTYYRWIYVRALV